MERILRTINKTEKIEEPEEEKKPEVPQGKTKPGVKSWRNMKLRGAV